MADSQAPEPQAQAAAGTLPLFYSNPEPLHSQRHGKLGLRRNFSFEFARNVNAIPINLVEMPQVCHFYPIIFSTADPVTPIALLGLRDKENLFIDEQGNWLPDTYIPAYVRRYPFVFSEVPGGEQLTLCIDVTENTVEEREDERFFNDDGSPTELSQKALEFCKTFQAAAQQTAPFNRAMSDSGLLVDRQVGINLDQDQRITFGGLRVVDEQKLSELPDERFLEWRHQGWLPLIYAHLFSAAQFERLTGLLRQKLASEASTGGGRPEAQDTPEAQDQ